MRTAKGVSKSIICVCESVTDREYQLCYAIINYLRLSFTQVNHSLWEKKTMPCTYNRHYAANHCILELYHILESVCTKMTTDAILKRITVHINQMLTPSWL